MCFKVFYPQDIFWCSKIMKIAKPEFANIHNRVVLWQYVANVSMRHIINQYPEWIVTIICDIFLLSVSPSMENEQKLQYFTNFISQMHIYNSMLMIWWVPSTFWALNFDICTSDNNSNRMRCIMTWIVKRNGDTSKNTENVKHKSSKTNKH